MAKFERWTQVAADIRRGQKWRDEYNGQPTPDCPDCASPCVIRGHHNADAAAAAAAAAAAPECDFWYCESCGHDWGHE